MIRKDDDIVAKLFNNIIYFDFGKHNIRPDAEVGLEKIITLMKQFPMLKIDVRSHTDSRSTESFNMALSQRRNTSVQNYITEKGGISSSRLTGKGYGDTQLVNACKSNVKCTEDMHQANRRTEFMYISNSSEGFNTKTVKKIIDDKKNKEANIRSLKVVKEKSNKGIKAIFAGNSSLSKGHYIITNLFSKPGNAVKWKEFLLSKGLSPQTFTNPKNNYEYVYIFNNEDIDLVNENYKKFKQIPYLKNIWVLEVN